MILQVLLWVCPLAAYAADEVVFLIHIDGPIGPATSGYIARAIQESASANGQCLILQMDTPGGLLDSTWTIVRDMLGSPIPTVVYVAPSGASAGSAGCFITLAADVAAMAPATVIGAAHPVSIGGGEGKEQSSDTMKQKWENFAVSHIEAIAEKRKRNVEWAKSSVKDSASITSDKALELKVIDLIAKDTDDLLKQLDGRDVSGKTLHTAGAKIIDIPMIAREKFFQMVWRPEVMLVLMLIAMYGIIGELSNPGAILPGVAGAIALILFLYMSATLPVNIAGVALIVLGLALFVIDIFAPTHGVLTAGGVIAFFLGAMMMFDRTEPMLRISLALLIPTTVLTAAFFAFVVGAGLRAQWLPRKVGVETLLGLSVPALSPIDSLGGKVFVDGAYWNATSDVPVEKGAAVEIIGIVGLTLKVRSKQS